jgi:hypothetical protein
MFKVKFDAPKGAVFPPVYEKATRAACVRLAALAAASVRPRLGLLVEWFGKDAFGDPALLDKVRRMAEVIADPDRTVTFVDARTHDLQVDYTPDDIYAEPRLHFQRPPRRAKAAVLAELGDNWDDGNRLPSEVKTPIAQGTALGEPRRTPRGPDAGGFYGYAFPVDSRGDGGPARAHAGSGMRIYLGNAYFASQKFFTVSPFSMEMVQTIYHEMTHKVLGTNDHFYGTSLCRREAKTQPLKVRQNADTFGYFATSVLGYVWAKDGS